MSQLEDRLTSLSPQAKRALVAQMLRKKLSATRIIHSLSSGQQSMWFIYQLAPESAAYNVVFTARICSAVNVPAMKDAFQALVDRHAALRATFRLIDGKLMQEIPGSREVAFERIDAASWNDEDLRSQVLESNQCPFDLENGPLLRVYLFTRTSEDHVLLIQAHHIVMDGLSVGVLLDEFRTLYAGECAGTPVSLPPLVAQYIDFVDWQEKMLASSEGERHWKYWQNQLAGDLPILNLAADYPRPPMQSFHGATQTFGLSEALTQKLRELAKACQTTLYTILLAAFQALLYRQTAQETILVGSPVAGRNQSEFAGIIGNLINMVVMRADFTGNLIFTKFLEQMRQTVLDALEHQDYPFRLLVEKLALHHDPSRSPIFQVTFDLQRLQRIPELAALFAPGKMSGKVNVGGLVFEAYPIPQQEGQFDLAMVMGEMESMILGALKYNTDLFSAARIARWVEQFQALLQSIVDHPDQRISELGLLTETELRTLNLAESGKMTIPEFISYLQSLDVRLWVEEDRLRISAPKGVVTPVLQTELSNRKSEILAFLQKLTVPSVVAPPLQPISRSERLPLSFSQQRLWFLDQFAPGNVAYNIFGAIRIKGSLDVQALEQTLGEIVRRHESLRTTFGVEDGQPFQQVAPFKSFHLTVQDLRTLPMSEREGEAIRLSREESQVPFELEHGPLFRARLLQLGDNEYFLLLAMHHIVSDGWSLGVFVHELDELYRAFVVGRASPLPDLEIQYADYAHWQRKWLQGETLDRQVAYWKEILGGSLPILELPADYPRPAEQGFAGAFKSVILATDLADALKALSRQENVTLFMTLLAAFQTLLYRYTGQVDLTVGAPVANRNRVEVEGLIGFFVNTLVMRTNLSGNPTFRELLSRVRHVALDAFAHPDVPFEILVETLHPERDPSHTPLFQVMFILQNAPMKEISLPGLTLLPVELDTGTAKFDLTFSAVEKTEGLAIYFEYNTDLFQATTIERMMVQFQTLLKSVATNPDQKVADMPILSETERQQLLVDWNATQLDYPRDLCIHQLLQKPAEQTPDAIAVVFGDKILTYRELDTRSNQLAHYLRKRGVGPDVLVGISIERSPEMVIALLGTLKAGGAYVPMDPHFPIDRLAYMMEDARVRVVLAQQRLQTDLAEKGVETVCLDTEWTTIARESREPVASSTTPQNLAYVIYTSGSTGRPKGVQITHRAVVNFLTSMQREPGLTQKDVLLAVTTLSFDIAGLEIYLPLTVGARVVIADTGVTSDGAQLLELLKQSGTTVMQATPTTWQLLLNAGWNANDKIEKILCGGEPLPRELVNQLLGCGDAVWNMYGPTETTIWSTVQRIERDEPITIGRPIANTEIYILDANLNPVPIGVIADLYIGGDGLARGYLNRPELTAEKFIRHPFRDEPDARLYKTGDLARYRADGKIEFLGRIDHQVKVRGFRIELGEIETKLGQHPQVQEAVVIAREDKPGDKRLVAYVIAKQQPAPAVTDLRNFLKEHLPDYMVPSAFMFLNAFPLTPNRKIDRRALPAPDQSRPELQAAYVAPGTDMEKTIAGIWQPVLNLERVGIHDNFFDLGGHSLLVVQIHNQLKKVTSREVTIADLFRYPTIHTLAGYLSREQTGTPSLQKVQDRIKMRQQALERRAQLGKGIGQVE